jgi:iron complex outermembrane receptor protein
VRPIRSLEPYGGNENQVDRILDELDPVVPHDENLDVNINNSPGKEIENWGHSLKANWDIGEHTLTSITAYREVSNLGFDSNIDNRPTSVLTISQGADMEQEQWTQEFRLTSPAGNRFSYVAGLFYFDQTMHKEIFRGFEFQPGNPGRATTLMDVDTTNWAVFGESSFDINDNWRLIAGLRYTEDEIDYVMERVQEGSGTALPKPIEPTSGGTDEDDLSGKIGLEWDFSDSGMAYLTYAEGYKGPAYDIIFGSDPSALEPLEPELSESWELGFKTTLWDERLRLNVAVFHTAYDDFQSQAYFDPDGDPGCPADNPGCDPEDDPGSFVLINAGDVETEGIEVDFVALLTPNLRLYGGFAFIDAKIVDYPGGVCSFGQVFRGECPDGLQDLSGGDMPFSPDWRAYITGQYSIDLDASFDLRLQATLKAQDEVLYDWSQDEGTVQDGYEILDLSLTAMDKSDRWQFTLYVKNALDEFYVQAINSEPDVFLPNGYTHIVPRHHERTFGGEVRFRWY